jgi:hypothetical protein
MDRDDADPQPADAMVSNLLEVEPGYVNVAIFEESPLA